MHSVLGKRPAAPAHHRCGNRPTPHRHPPALGTAPAPPSPAASPTDRDRTGDAAHPGAEREVFPERAVRNTALVAYTATSWGQLLRRPSGWEEPVPSAGDCYRFCLSNDAVDVVLSGPASLAQLDENLEALKKGPLSADEMAWMRRFGALVHKRSLMPGAPR